jgi:hypothetical protein
MPFLDRLKPDEAEIRTVALRETDPRYAAEFEPFTKGPLVAVILLLATGMAAVPLILWRLLTKKSV